MATDADGPRPGEATGEDPAAASTAPPPDEVPVEPPRDADDWTDEQWLAWLEQTDTDDDVPATRVGRLQRSAGGMVLGNAMRGLAEAIYGVTGPQIVVEVEAPGEPGGEDLSVHLDPDDPERSTVVVRRSRRRPPPGG